MKRYPLPNSHTAAGAVILADGEYPPAGSVARAILDGAAYVVCCDGAADAYAADGGTPAAIVGDGDSISAHTARRFADRLHIAAEQESNDLTKAVRFCLAQGIGSIIILGATGRREDHTLGNVSLLADYASQADVCMVTTDGVFNAVTGGAEFVSYVRQQVSLFVIDPSTKLTADGLQYPLPADGFRSWWCGTLNKALGDSFRVASEGMVIVYRAF